MNALPMLCNTVAASALHAGLCAGICGAKQERAGTVRARAGKHRRRSAAADGMVAVWPAYMLLGERGSAQTLGVVFALVESKPDASQQTA